MPLDPLMCPKPLATEVVVMPAPLPPPTPWPVTWAPVASACGVFLVGAAAAAIAYRQWRTAHTKLQLELYEKRLPIYRASRAMLAKLGTEHEMPITSVAAFGTETADAALLFDKHIARFVRDIWEASIEENAYRSLTESPRLDYTTKWARAAERAGWAKRQYDKLDELFFPYLQLEKSRTKRPTNFEPLPRDLGKPPAPAS